jgi:DNA repair ATPase RecN
MKYGKAVEEVWAWREALAKEIENLSPHQQREHINNKADEAIRKYGIKVKTMPEYSVTRWPPARQAPTKIR